MKVRSFGRRSMQIDICAILLTLIFVHRPAVICCTRWGFLDKFAEYHIGPILFREELLYFKEIHLDEYVQVKVELTKYNKNNSRFSFMHQVFRSDGTRCCTVHVDGAWLDLQKRKLTKLPEELAPLLAKIPRAEKYEETE